MHATLPPDLSRRPTAAPSRGVRRKFLPFLLTLALLLAAPFRAGAAELWMFEEQGCYWCETWLEEIGPVYPKTWESKVAPLRRIDITDPVPEGVSLQRSIQYTPTFVLIENGREIGRIEGYPGEDFFWALLDQMLEKLPEGRAAMEESTDAPPS